MNNASHCKSISITIFHTMIQELYGNLRLITLSDRPYPSLYWQVIENYDRK